MPSKIPLYFTQRKSFRFPQNKDWSRAKRSVGQKSSFICSKVDSFTPEKGATRGEKDVHSYKKCKRTPPRDATKKPDACQSRTDRFFTFRLLWNGRAPFCSCTDLKPFESRLTAHGSSICSDSSRYAWGFCGGRKLFLKKRKRASFRNNRKQALFYAVFCLVLIFLYTNNLWLITVWLNKWLTRSAFRFIMGAEGSEYLERAEASFK